MNLIKEKFEALKRENRKTLIAYITSGDPDINTTVNLAVGMSKAGADIIELGIPYSDPVSEGPVIQRSHLRAIQASTNTDSVLDAASKIREKSDVPLVLLTYFNCILQYDINRFFSDCKNCGVNGVIIPDLPYEENQEVMESSMQNDVYVITLVSPTSENRLDTILKGAKGFIYCVSSLGVTGVRQDFHSNLKRQVEQVKLRTDIPAAVGFGISNASQVREIKQYADGVIIGSAIVKKIEEALIDNRKNDDIIEFIREIREALDE